MMTAMKPRRQLGPFDATMIVMGGIVGAGIFANPSEVAHRVHTPSLILAAWLIGGVIALCGAFIWAELATRLPGAGGQYLYLREAYHPAVAFVYGWSLLLVTQTGGMAAVAVTFASYFRRLTGAGWSDGAIAAVTLLALTAVNCFGARAGSNLQNVLMLLKIGAIAALVVIGFAFAGKAIPVTAPEQLNAWQALGAALVPVAFSYGGWQTSTFLAGEMRDPRRDLARGLILGVCGVVALYVAVNLVCLRVLGAAGLDATTTPASEVMRAALGERGARWIAVGIAVSTLGFLSQSMLTTPRVYFAMSRDRLFFDAVGRVWNRSGAPVTAILLQGAAATIIACSGKYGEILNFAITVDFIAFGMTAAAIFVLRRRGSEGVHLTPGHPYTTGLFVLGCVAIVGSAIAYSPANSAIAIAIMLAGIPVYWFWTRRRA
jgi:APA family basic amino acid/polyamine antiporter